jgi:hypothetical protein
MNNPSQKTLPNDTLHLQETNIHAICGIWTRYANNEKSHTDTLDGGNIGIGCIIINCLKQTVFCTKIQALCILATDCVFASYASQNKLRHHSLTDL